MGTARAPIRRANPALSPPVAALGQPVMMENRPGAGTLLENPAKAVIADIRGVPG